MNARERTRQSDLEGPRAAPGLLWPALGDADLSRVDATALVITAHFLWQYPAALWDIAGAGRRPTQIGAWWRWDTEDMWLIEHVSDRPVWFGPDAPGWRRRPDDSVAFDVTHTIRCLPELTVRELALRGAQRLDARLGSLRAAGRELGWRPISVRRFASRQVPFHPMTAEVVCKWLALSTGWRGTFDDGTTTVR